MSTCAQFKYPKITKDDTNQVIMSLSSDFLKMFVSADLMSSKAFSHVSVINL